MATIASQVVLHPLVSNTLKFGSTTLGRDKTYRAVQYLARFLAWYLIVRERKEDAVRWTALKAHIGTARKLLRLGKPVEHLQAALRATTAPGPAAEQITAIGRQLGYFGFLSFDTLVWAQTIKFINLSPDTAKKVAKTSNRFWLAGILFSIVHGVLKTIRLRKEARRLQTASWKESDLGKETERETRLRTIKELSSTTRRQLTMDFLDIWIPATGAEVVGVSEGLLGIFGLITSIMGAKSQWTAVNGKR